MPNTTCDLHLHTYYSDGRTSPAEILRYAAEIGLKTVAITDHDNLNAAREAATIAAELGLELIPGIELTSRWDRCPGQEVDILGYFVDPADPEFLRFVQGAFADLRPRIVDCCQRLSAAGTPVTIYDVEDENPRYPGALQLVKALLNKGHAKDWNEALALFTEQWRSIRPSKYTTQEVIAAIHAAGGAAILAHPVAIRCLSGWLQAIDLADLVQAGLDGLEVLHPRLDGPARQHFTSLAKQFGLAITGGSDEHGWQDGFSRLGSELVTYEMVTVIRERAGQRSRSG